MAQRSLAASGGASPLRAKAERAGEETIFTHSNTCASHPLALQGGAMLSLLWVALCDSGAQGPCFAHRGAPPTARETTRLPAGQQPALGNVGMGTSTIEGRLRQVPLGILWGSPGVTRNCALSSSGVRQEAQACAPGSGTGSTAR